ncbi:MAG TPA: LuxR C-terminal-related transcriptional regulator [Ktedonobacteraceae bacterium]
MTPTVQGETLVYLQHGQEQELTVGTPAWFAWLETASTFSFVSEEGLFTARHERSGQQRGGRYWKAYRKQHGKLSSHYLGKSETLSLERLRAVAVALAAAPVGTAHAGDADLPASSVPPAGDQLDPLLASKLHPPRPRTQLVRRARLHKLLQQGMERALTLVSAPAGFGKTTLVANFLAESDTPVAWLSLEPEDNDPVRFLSYLIAALQRLDPQVGTAVLPLLQAPRSAPLERVLALVINDLIAGAPRDFALVLDDYHVITTEAIHRVLIFLLGHLPAPMHLIIATRADPPLLLAGLRARGQLTEVRAADLRFATDEVSAFLREVMHLDLEAWAIAALEHRTEGWIAGLQLAALSLQGGIDVSTFLAAFSGSHRFVLDYLSEEVLSRQPAAVQTFLLHTCILEQLSGALCDAVTGQEGSQAMLEALDRANLFVVALDEERGWYRYHHLFAEVLKSRLQQAEAPLVAELHRRASAWYEQHEMQALAIEHALAAPDFERATRLIEQHGISFALRGQVHTMLGWLNALPEAVVRRHARLGLYSASMLLFTNQVEAAETRLQEIEQGLQGTVPAEQDRVIRGQIAFIRANLLRSCGDLARGLALIRQALELLPETEERFRLPALVGVASSYLVSGDVTPTAEHVAVATVASLRASDDLFALLQSITCLARLQGLQGQLRRAASTYGEAVRLFPGQGGLQSLLGSPAYYFGLGDLLREWNELDAAERHLVDGMDLIRGTLTVFADEVTLGYLALARLQQARGEYRQALATLDAFMDLAQERHFVPHLLARGRAVRAQVELAQDNLAAALRWADGSGLSLADEDLSYPREQEYLALVRVRIAQGREDLARPFLQEALGLLDRLLQDADAKARLGSALEILVLRALALSVRGDRKQALTTLEQALTRAEPEGYVCLFVDEGGPMRSLLRETQACGIAPNYVAQLLSAFGGQHVSGPAVPAGSALVEPLTEREREVLDLLSTGASNSEIARSLVVSPGTVKKHVYNICGKLGTQRRTQAVARARELNLL